MLPQAKGAVPATVGIRAIHTQLNTDLTAHNRHAASNPQVDYGEKLRLVGNQPFLGNWDPTKGAKMTWSEGNLWQTNADIAIGTDVSFKVGGRKGGGVAAGKGARG